MYDKDNLTEVDPSQLRESGSVGWVGLFVNNGV